MTGLLDTIETRVLAAVAGLAFDDPANPGATVTPRIVRGGLPPKRSGGPVQGEDFPFVIVRPMRGAGNLKALRPAYRLVGGIYTAGAIDDGIIAVDRLFEVLSGIWSDRAFTPYRLADEMTWFFGDEKDGVQPHPYYYVTFDMQFIGAPRAGYRR